MVRKDFAECAKQRLGLQGKVEQAERLEAELACIGDYLNVWCREQNYPEAKDYLGECVLRDSLKGLHGHVNSCHFAQRDRLEQEVTELWKRIEHLKQLCDQAQAGRAMDEENYCDDKRRLQQEVAELRAENMRLMTEVRSPADAELRNTAEAARTFQEAAEHLRGEVEQLKKDLDWRADELSRQENADKAREIDHLRAEVERGEQAHLMTIKLAEEVSAKFRQANAELRALLAQYQYCGDWAESTDDEGYYIRCCLDCGNTLETGCTPDCAISAALREGKEGV